MTNQELNKKDWINLYNNGLITARGIENWSDNEFKKLNGHVYTTDLADKMIISRNRYSNIHIGKNVYSVKYFDGCFYPFWYKNLPYKKTELNYKLINKKLIQID